MNLLLDIYHYFDNAILFKQYEPMTISKPYMFLIGDVVIKGETVDKIIVFRETKKTFKINKNKLQKQQNKKEIFVTTYNNYFRFTPFEAEFWENV